MSDYLFNKTGDDPAVAELEGLLGVYAHRAPLRAPPPPRRRWRTATASGLAVLALAIAVIALWRSDGDDCQAGGAGFSFAVEGGSARCGGGVASRGTLPIGAWLETSPSAVAAVTVANIGKLTVYGDTRVRLVDTSSSEHRMELARGKVAAQVVAPPRLFVVDTPGATAVDLGCAYELTVDEDGRTWLRVSSGVVSLEGHGLVAYVPMDAEVVAVPGRGPGTPVAIHAPDVLRSAVARFDAGDRAAVLAIVEGAELRDTVTLWNLLSRTTGDHRAAVVARLEKLTGVPDTVRTEDVLAGDADAIERWREALDERWMCPGCFE